MKLKGSGIHRSSPDRREARQRKFRVNDSAEYARRRSEHGDSDAFQQKNSLHLRRPPAEREQEPGFL